MNAECAAYCTPCPFTKSLSSACAATKQGFFVCQAFVPGMYMSAHRYGYYQDVRRHVFGMSVADGFARKRSNNLAVVFMLIAQV